MYFYKLIINCLMSLVNPCFPASISEHSVDSDDVTIHYMFIGDIIARVHNVNILCTLDHRMGNFLK